MHRRRRRHGPELALGLGDRKDMLGQRLDRGVRPGQHGDEPRAHCARHDGGVERALARRGWIEVVSRRPSGQTKFLVRSENVPMVRLGDVDQYPEIDVTIDGADE